MAYRVLLPVIRQTCPNLSLRRSQLRHTAPTMAWVWKGAANGLDGSGHISGILRVTGQPARRRILCIDAQTNLIARQTWSNEDGTYRIDRLNPTREYHVIAVDDNKAVDSWSTSFITPCGA